MEMEPIKFVIKYSDTTIRAGFKSFKNEDGDYITERQVTAMATNWASGAAISFTITETFYNTNKGAGIHTRELASKRYYYNPGYNIATEEQQALIDALADGDLRGRYACNIAMMLYHNLFVLDKSDDSPMKIFLPEVVTIRTKN